MSTSQQPGFPTPLYTTHDAVATITLNRPAHLNAIVSPMPDEIEAAVRPAERSPTVKAFVLRVAGRAFSGATTSAARSSTGART